MKKVALFIFMSVQSVLLLSDARKSDSVKMPDRQVIKDETRGIAFKPERKKSVLQDQFVRAKDTLPSTVRKAEVFTGDFKASSFNVGTIAARASLPKSDQQNKSYIRMEVDQAAERSPEDKVLVRLNEQSSVLKDDLGRLMSERDVLLDQLADGDPKAEPLIQENEIQGRISGEKLAVLTFKSDQLRLQENINKLAQKEKELQEALQGNPNDKDIEKALEKVKEVRKNLEDQVNELTTKINNSLKTVRLETERLKRQQYKGVLQDELARLNTMRSDLLDKFSGKYEDIVKEVEGITKELEDLNDTIQRLQESEKYLEKNSFLLAAEVAKNDQLRSRVEDMLIKAQDVQKKHAQRYKEDPRSYRKKRLNDSAEMVNSLSAILQRGDQVKKQLEFVTTELKDVINREADVKEQYSRKLDEYNEKIIQLDDVAKESEEAAKNSRELQEIDFLIQENYEQSRINDLLMRAIDLEL